MTYTIRHLRNRLEDINKTLEHVILVRYVCGNDRPTKIRFERDRQHDIDKIIAMRKETELAIKALIES